MKIYVRMLAALLLGYAAAGQVSGEAQAVNTTGKEPVQAELRYFCPVVSGSVGGKDYFSERTYEHKLDLRNDLGLEKAQAPEVKLIGPNWDVDFTRLRSTQDGQRLRAPITYKNHTYKGNLDTDMDMECLSVNWHQPIKSSERMEIWWSAGAKYVRLHARSTGFNASNRAESDEDSASGILPAVGAGAHWFLGQGRRWQAAVSVNGMPLGGHGHIGDLEAELSWLPSAQWKLAAGWRFLDMELHRDDKNASYQAQGPFFSIGCSF